MVVGSNWKIYITSQNDAYSYMKVLNENLKPFNTNLIDVYILPDFINLEVVRHNIKSPIFLVLMIFSGKIWDLILEKFLP